MINLNKNIGNCQDNSLNLKSPAKMAADRIKHPPNQKGTLTVKYRISCMNIDN